MRVNAIIITTTPTLNGRFGAGVGIGVVIVALTLRPFAKYEKPDRYLQRFVGVVVHLCVK